MKLKILFFFICTVAVLAGCRDGNSQIESSDKIIIGSMEDIPAQGGHFSVPCAAEREPDTPLTPSTEADWLTSLEWSDGVLSFEVGPNIPGPVRETSITVSGEGCEDAVLVIRQAEPDFELYVEIEAVEGEDYSVDATFTPSNDSMTYCTGIMLTSDIEQYPDGNAFVEYLLERMEAEAREAGIYLTTLLKRTVIAGVSDSTFSNLQPDTPYTIYAVSLDVMGKSEGVLFTCEYTTPSSLYPDAVFDFNVLDATTTSIDVEVTPSYPEVPYYIDIVSESDYNEKYGDDNTLAYSMVEEIRFLIEYYTGMGMDFSFADFIKTGHIERHQLTGLIPETGYYIYAFGLSEEGMVLSPVSKISQSTDPVVITDGCTFDIAFSNIRPTDFDMAITPSSGSTRYYVQVALGGILESNTPEELAGMFINIANQNGMDWSSSSQLYTGQTTLNTYSDLNYAPFEAQTEYVVFVFGVNSSGERTTEVAYSTCTTGQTENSDMTIDIAVSDIGPATAHIICTPSNDDEFYYYDLVTSEEFSRFGSDSEFIEYALQQGEINGTFQLYKGRSEYLVSGNYLRPDTEYTVFAFGYSGGATTPVFHETFRTQIREFSDASLNITYTVRDGNEIYRQDPVKNYDFEGKAAIVFTIEPTGSAASWYFSGFGNSMDYLMALDEEELLYSIQSNGRGNYNKTEVMYAVAWGSTLCGAGYAMDSGGREGRPVVIEAVIPKN